MHEYVSARGYRARRQKRLLAQAAHRRPLSNPYLLPIASRKAPAGAVSHLALLLNWFTAMTLIVRAGAGSTLDLSRQALRQK